MYESKSVIYGDALFQGQGLVLAGFYFCFTWVFAYPALLRFPDHEIPDFYPIFIMLHTWHVSLVNKII